jgi:formylglycine-generating enzyme required for sulfatase activity/tRNA A-37 threonylcarbamoyl transferase component Bud32
VARNWDREVALFAERDGLDEREAGAVQRFVDALLRLDSVEVSTESVTWSERTTQAFTHADAETEEREAPIEIAPEKRYLDLGMLGTGGMGEVRRVRDVVLNRFLAMKILRPELATKRAAVVRFIAEAQATAQLQHPGVVPVHDIGRLPDGRWYFTMKELVGQTLEEVIQAHLAGSAAHGLRAMMEIYARVCDAVAYAHAHGAVHRDLKPANILVGRFGEVVVVDWGLVKAFGSPNETAHVVTDLGALKTKMGTVLGTPAYMPPEQARGDHDQVGPASDVYALGAVLYEVLSGRRPYEGSTSEVVEAILQRAPKALPSTVPAQLAEICVRAMAREPEARFPNAGEVGAAVRSWLDGAARRERALEILGRADALQPEVEGALRNSERLAAEAHAYLDSVPTWAGIDAKRPGWALEDRAEAERLRADIVGVERLQLLRAALEEMPGMTEVHERLAYVYHFCHQRAERLGDLRETAQYERLLRDHDRGRYAAYLQGDGVVTVRTRPPGAEVELFRFELRDRRLVAVPAGQLPPTPFDRHTLGRGSWLLRFKAVGRAPVDYPVHLGRGDHWHGLPPGARAPTPIVLPWRDELGPEDCYVPAGWFQFGETPGRWLWLDAFVMRRFPVTNREYVEFLDDLVVQGRAEEAERHQPRPDGGPCYRRRSDGRFELPTDEHWAPDAPVTSVDHPAATAFARWMAARTGFPWRLPWEAEWEKAARGVDGRKCPMGDFMDPAWADIRGSRGRFDPRAWPDDVSVYGVRGTMGGAGDWCADAWQSRARDVEGRPIFQAADPMGGQAVWRGGFRSIPVELARTTTRHAGQVWRRLPQIGLRLARGLEPEDDDPEISGVWVLKSKT